jgi:anti-anti-sigma factor
VRIPLPRNETTASASLEVEGELVRIRAYGEFDIDSASTLASALDDATESGFSVILDLAATTFIDMFALRTIIAATQRLHADGRTLRVVNASSLISRLFQVTDLTDLLSA